MHQFQQIYITDIEPSIYRHRGIFEFHIQEDTITRQQFKDYLQAISKNLGMKPHPEQPHPIITSATGHTLEKHNGFEGMLFWLESGMHAYYWETAHLIALDMHSCAFLDKDKVINTTHQFFTLTDSFYLDILPKH